MKTKILLTPKEYEAFLRTYWTDFATQYVENDPDWGYSGSGVNWVVYFNVEFTPTQLISIGRDIQCVINQS
jgi:hypothetical protein